MDKKIFSLIASILIFSYLLPICFASPTSGADESIVIPAPDETVWFADRPVGHTAVTLGTYISEDIRSLDDDGFDIVIQYDWSVGDSENWNYTSKWDDYKKSPMFDMIGRDELFIGEVFWLLYDETYEVFEDITELDEVDGTEVRYIDFSKNTIYMRARYIAVSSDGTRIISDWSDIRAVTDQSNAVAALEEITPPVLSDLTLGDGEISFRVTPDASFRHAVLLLKLMNLEAFSLNCTIISDTTEITAAIPYADGINKVELPENVILPKDEIITLNVDIINETGISVFDSIASPQPISSGIKVLSSTPAYSQASSEVSSSASQPESEFNNAKTGAVIIGTVVLCILAAVAVSSVGKKRRNRSAWH